MGNSQANEQTDKIFSFTASENPAAIGGRLEESYIPKPNDANVLATTADKLNSLLKNVEKLLDEIKSHDQSLFESNGLTLKKKCQSFHHTCNESFITSLSQIELEINTILTKVEEASTRFNVVCKQRKVYENSAAINKRKNDKKMKKGKHKHWKRIWNNFCHICLLKMEYITWEGLIVHDCDIKVDREQPLAITASKIKHIVHLLNMGNFSHQAKCTILDLVPDSLGTKLLNQMDNQAMIENTSDTSSDQDADTADDQVMPDTTLDFATEHDIDAIDAFIGN